jgi:hypothetical protein
VGTSTSLTLVDSSGGLNIAGDIGTANGLISIATSGGSLSVGNHSIRAGGYGSTPSSVSLTGQGVTLGASGNIIASNYNLTSGVAGGATGAGDGGAITITAHDGTAAGAVTLLGTIRTANADAAALKIRGTKDLVLPLFIAPNGGLTLGDGTSGGVGLVDGNVTQVAGSSINVTSVTVGTSSIGVNGTVNLGNTGNRVGTLLYANVAVNGSEEFDFDLYDAAGGLALGGAISSAGGVRLQTTNLSLAGSGALALGAHSISASGNVTLLGASISQDSASVINATVTGSSGVISFDGSGGANTITLAGSVQTTDASDSAISILNATSATLNNLTATSGGIVLGTDTANISAAVTQASDGVLKARRLSGDVGSANIERSQLDELGPFIARTATGFTLKDQAGSGPSGLEALGNIAVAGPATIETSNGSLRFGDYSLNVSGLTAKMG